MEMAFMVSPSFIKRMTKSGNEKEEGATINRLWSITSSLISQQEI